MTSSTPMLLLMILQVSRDGWGGGRVAREAGVWGGGREGNIVLTMEGSNLPPVLEAIFRPLHFFVLGL